MVLIISGDASNVHAIKIDIEKRRIYEGVTRNMMQRTLPH